jgi:hypothetical protein
MYSDIAPKPKVVHDHNYPTCAICGVCLMCVEDKTKDHNKEIHNATTRNEAENTQAG